jgi:RNA polymerase sigma-70 factor (ECF subfamily)
MREQDSLYAQVADEFGAALERLARAYERNADERQALLQEIHVALWRSLPGFKGRCSIRTWVYRVAHNIATSHAVRSRARAPIFVAPENLEAIPDPVRHEPQLDRRLALDKLHELIRQLHPIDRQVMLLYLEDLEAAAIAEITGLSAGNVSTKIHRLKQVLTRRFHQRKTGHD